MNGFVQPNKKPKWHSVVSAALYAAVVVVMLAFILVQIFLPQKSVQLFGFNFYKISYTGSMEPMLEYNDLIVVHKFDFEKLEVGDVITFLARTAADDEEVLTVTHKIVRKEIDPNGKKMFFTQGINNDFPDLRPVTVDGADGTNIYLGKYAFKSAFLGNFIAYLQSTAGSVALLIDAAMIVLMMHFMPSKTKMLKV